MQTKWSDWPSALMQEPNMFNFAELPFFSAALFVELLDFAVHRN